ncbi:hypothetical protein [Aureimonas psammosilenae]|uniref:hypothetical protein n=1 Tax=Aureimonas psammosilenae TaxID=2495496 RepID=UPI0012609D5C|nr:hypothetical protein [Aureimonas psammosilenae]
MTSNAKSHELYEGVEWTLRGASEEMAPMNNDDQPRVLALAPVPLPSASRSGEASDAPARPDWASAITLVQEAAEAIRYREDRIEQLRRAAEEQTQQHLADLKAVHAQLMAAQKEIEAANARADAAEARTREANEWLGKLHEAITGNLSSIGRI